MARKKTVEITMIDGTKGFVPAHEFETFGVPETAEAVIGSYIAGSKGPILKVNTLADMSGTYFYVNPHLIVSFTVVYD